MIKKYMILLLSVMFFLTGCNSKKEEFKISVNTWIGYAPLFYADAQGWLSAENIKLIHTVSLNESLQLYDEGFVNAMTSTQYEAEICNKKVYPIILLDKSYGADVIMSNYSIDELKKFKKINVYLEIDSVNSLLLNYFIKRYGFDKSKLNIINKDQAQIVADKYDSFPTIIVTYAPYDDIVAKKGFKILASTKTSSSLIVLDAVFSDEKNIKLYNDKFVKLKKFVDLALKDLQKNPKRFYYTIKPYYVDYSYEDFLADLHNIKWLNEYTLENKEILKQLKMDDKRLIK